MAMTSPRLRLPHPNDHRPHAIGDYVVEIAAGSSPSLGALLDAVQAPARRFVVSSPPIWRFHGATLRRR